MAVALTLAFGGVAYANFGPHGGYIDDTDACAGCHRAHTSFSTLTWTDDTVAGAEHSALLISDADFMFEFCNACHGDDAPGASTNVVSGVFDSGPSGVFGDLAGADNDGVQVEYLTNSSFDATLNGGGFERVPVGVAGGPNSYKASTSVHGMTGSSYPPADPLWGDNDGTPQAYALTCTSCHDPHGSSNYRLLKDYVNGNTVGGFIDDDNPTPFVESAEEGYPTSVGWRKHEAGAAQMALYRPNYTSAEYYNNGDPTQNMSGWCAACHERYIVRNDALLDVVGPSGDAATYGFSSTTYDYGDFIESSTAPSAGTNLGPQEFHRHPVNVNLVGGDPDGYVPPAAVQTSWLRTYVVTTTVLPLEMKAAGDAATFRAGEWSYDDYLGCLTCHRAHGSSADMTGWAEASLESTDGTSWYPQREAQDAGDSGVAPNFTSALLRADNRGVCERCHNK